MVVRQHRANDRDAHTGNVEAAVRPCGRVPTPLMSSSLSGIATTLVADLGYWGLSVGLCIDSFGFPIPSEVLIPLAVVTARQGHLSLVAVVAVSLVSQVAGALLSYVVGRRAGLPAVKRFGRFVGISPAHLDRAHRVFERRGGWITGVGRCIPLVRGLIGFPAGAARMSFGAFAGWTVAGSAVWTAVLVALGELLSANIGVIDRVFARVSVVVGVLLAAAAVLAVRRARSLARKRAVPSTTALDEPPS